MRRVVVMIAALGTLAGCGLITGDAFDVRLATKDASDAATPGDGAVTADGGTSTNDADASATAAKIVAGASHTCAYFGKKRWCWGLNADGELGDGSSIDRAAAVVVANGAASFDDLAAGQHHTCAIAEGALACSGANDKGQLAADASVATSLVPRAIAASSLGGTPKAVAVSDESTCALLADGSVTCWGANESGQLGSGATSPAGNPTPARVSGFGAAVTAIAGGAAHFCAIASGAVWCWGWNRDGQIGDESMADRPTPVRVHGLDSVTVAAVAAGASHTCALATTGAVSCWGDNEGGQIGDGSTTPRPAPASVSGLVGVKALSGGRLHTCALSADGVHCWGHNDRGQLGDNSTEPSLVPFAVAVGVLDEDVVSITAGGDHSCAMSAAGKAWCWGANDKGQLGNGAQDDGPFPSVVGLP